MGRIDITMLSDRYRVRKLNHNDVDAVYSLCEGTVQFYRYSGRQLSRELIIHDMEIAPPNIPMEQKYFIGFFDNDSLVAVMDLIDGYPDHSYAYIGFFMLDISLQGAGVGSMIIRYVLEYLAGLGFNKCRLGIDKANPQSTHFWAKNRFETTREVTTDDGIILVAEKPL